MKSIENYTDEFISKIKATPEYQKFEKKRLALQENPELMKRVNEYRRQKMQIQASENAYDKVDEFHKMNEEFYKNQLTMEYMEAELSLCRMLQAVMGRIVGSIELDLDKKE